MDRTYRDSAGNRVDLAVLCAREPGWATNRILELTRQVDALLRGNAQMRLLAGLPLPPEVVAKLSEANRLRMEADERLRAVRKLLEWNGCECECEHHWEDHDDDCDRCLACRLGEAVGK